MFLLRAFRDPLARDALVPRGRHADREVRFVTARFPASVMTFADARAAARRALRAIGDRCPISAAFGLVAPSPRSGGWHAHFILTVPTITPSVARQVDISAGANLKVQLARGPHEVRWKERGGWTSRRHRDFRSPEAADLMLGENAPTISAIGYVAAQMPEAVRAASSDRSPVILHHLEGFAAARDAYVDELRQPPAAVRGRVPPLLRNVLPEVMADHLAWLDFDSRRGQYKPTLEWARRLEYGPRQHRGQTFPGGTPDSLSCSGIPRLAPKLRYGVTTNNKYIQSHPFPQDFSVADDPAPAPPPEPKVPRPLRGQVSDTNLVPGYAVRGRSVGGDPNLVPLTTPTCPPDSSWLYYGNADLRGLLGLRFLPPVRQLPVGAWLGAVAVRRSGRPGGPRPPGPGSRPSGRSRGRRGPDARPP